MNPKDTICKYRWSYPLVDLGAGSVKTCCHTAGTNVNAGELYHFGKKVFLNHPFHVQRRQEMLNGVRHAQCHTCWRLEDAGAPSPRQGAELFTKYMNRFGFPGTFEEILKQPHLLEAKNPTLIEIILSNSCDLKCLYCNQHFSSAWEVENKTHGIMVPGERTQAPAGFEEKFWEWFEECYSSLEYISFVGGEPLLIPKFYRVLDRLLNLYGGQPNLPAPMLGVISNLNASERNFDKFLETLKRLSPRFQVLLLVSVDTVGRKAEVIRTGLVWERLLKNMRRLLAMNLDNLHFTINPTINTMSVTSMIELLRLAKSLREEFRIPVALGRNMVVEPRNYSPLYLTPDFAPYLEECAEFVAANVDERYPVGPHGDWSAYAEFLGGLAQSIRAGGEKSADRALFYSGIREMERRRNFRFLDTFPEYEAYFNECKNAWLRIEQNHLQINP